MPDSIKQMKTAFRDATNKEADQHPELYFAYLSFIAQCEISENVKQLVNKLPAIEDALRGSQKR